MSAVVGLFHRDGRPVEAETVRRMVATMPYRSPDGTAVWTGGPAGLGHGALHATPEAVHERLPLTVGPLTVTADVRLDNRPELLARLGLRDRPGIGDGELILRAYERWGERCPEHLLGSFAFALWDARRRALFCARDHMGTKPICVARTDRFVAVSSDPRGLLALDDVPTVLNEGRIADYLIGYTEAIDHTSTFFEGIEKLPPARSLTVTVEAHHERAYWSLFDAPERRFASDEEAVEAFREVFEEAVRCRLRSVGPVGSALSGGIDSSSIVAVAAQQLLAEGRGPLHTFSGVTNDPDCRETAAVHAVLNHVPGLDPCLFTPEDLPSYAEPLEEIIARIDDLFDANMLELRYVTARAAQKRGLRVLLDGVDGDLLLGSTLPFPSAHLASWRARLAYEESRLFCSMYELDSPMRFFWARGIRPLLVDRIPYAIYDFCQNAKSKRHISIELDFPVSKSFARRVDLRKRIQDKYRRGAPPLNARSSMRFRHAHLLHRPTLTVGIERYERLASHYACEARHPLIDTRLLELCVGLDISDKIRNGHSKWLLRIFSSQYLPSSISYRRSWDTLLGALFAREHFNTYIYDKFNLEKINGSDYAELVEYDDMSCEFSPQTWYATMLTSWLSSAHSPTNAALRTGRSNS